MTGSRVNHVIRAENNLLRLAPDRYNASQQESSRSANARLIARQACLRAFYRL
jgi:hypothetical protein